MLQFEPVEIVLLALTALFVLIGLIRRTRGKSREHNVPVHDGTKEPLPQLRAQPPVDRETEKPRLVPEETTEPVIPTTPKRTPKPFDTTDNVKPMPTGTECVGSAYVIDGDSIVIKGTQIRLFGVDAPEMNHPYGKKAKWALVNLCKGQDIRAELIEMDAHGRTVAKCFLPDGRDLSAEMVKQGLAIDWPKFSGGVYSELETPDARKKMWLANARQKGHMHVWRKFEAEQAAKAAKNS